MELMFKIVSESNNRGLIDEKETFEIVNFILDEAKSNRYVNKRNLFSLINSLNLSFVENNKGIIETKLKVK